MGIVLNRKCVCEISLYADNSQGLLSWSFTCLCRQRYPNSPQFDYEHTWNDLVKLLPNLVELFHFVKSVLAAFGENPLELAHATRTERG
jgi:hypothetical protein